MPLKRTVNRPAYCPVCDKKFDSHRSRAKSMKMVKDHVNRAHPEYDPNWATD